MTTNQQGSFNDKQIPDPDGEIAGMIEAIQELKPAYTNYGKAMRSVRKALPEVTEDTRFVIGESWTITRRVGMADEVTIPGGLRQGRMKFERQNGAGAPEKPAPRSRRRRNPNEPHGPTAIEEQRRAHEATGA